MAGNKYVYAHTVPRSRCRQGVLSEGGVGNYPGILMRARLAVACGHVTLSLLARTSRRLTQALSLWSRGWPCLLCFPFLSPRRTLVIASPLIQDACAHAQSLSHVQLSETQRTRARQAPLSMGLSRQEYWSGLPCPSPGDLPDPGIKLVLLHCKWILYRLSHLGLLI